MSKPYSADIIYPEEDAEDFKKFETEQEMEEYIAQEQAAADERGEEIVVDRSTDEDEAADR